MCLAAPAWQPCTKIFAVVSHWLEKCHLHYEMQLNKTYTSSTYNWSLKDPHSSLSFFLSWRMRNSSSKSVSLSIPALDCSLFFFRIAFLISIAHLLRSCLNCFCEFRSSSIFLNRLLFPLNASSSTPSPMPIRCPSTKISVEEPALISSLRSVETATTAAHPLSLMLQRRNVFVQKVQCLLLFAKKLWAEIEKTGA